MKTTHRILGITLATLLSAAGGFAQTTATPPTGTPAGSQTTGTTNSGGVAPASGKPASTPTGPTAGGTGSGTTAPTPATTTSGGTTSTTGTTAATPGNASPHTPNEHASDTAKAVQAVISKFEAKRDAAMAAREALLDKLHAATTDAERQAIITQLRTESQAEKDEQSAMGKQIRDELKALRDQRKSGG